MSAPLRPGRVELRTGHRPHTAFGHDDDLLALRATTYRSADGHTWDALLARPREGPESPAVIVLVHGATGNYLSGVPRRLALSLASLGYPTLSINTRMANFGAAYGGGMLDAVPADLDGALRLAGELGFSRVVMAGYQLGAVAVTHHQAARTPPEVAALVTIAHPASLPDSLRDRWTRNGARPSYEQMSAAARPVARGDGADRTVVVARGSGPTDAPGDAEIWTYLTWWASRGPEAPWAVSRERIREVTVPTIVLQPDDESGRRDGEALRRSGAAGGARVDVEFLPDTDRTLWDAVPRAAERAAEWLGRELPALAPRARRRPAAVTGTHHRLVTLVASDGTEHDALVHRDPQAEATRREHRLAVLHMHGNQGNLTVGTLRFLPDPVAASGCAMMVVETRIANASQLVGHAVLSDALADLRAGAEWLWNEGYPRIVLSGYSLGGVLAVRIAAENPPWLAGLMIFGADWSLPETSRIRMTKLGAEPSYDELVELCRPRAEGGPRDIDDSVIVVRRAFGADDLPRNGAVFSARSWWASRGPEAVDAMPGRRIGSVRAPVLIVQGLDDVIADPGDAERLARAAREGGNDRVRVTMVAGAGHSFRGAEDTVAGAVTGFLADL